MVERRPGRRAGCPASLAFRAVTPLGYTLSLFHGEASMQDINPILHQINDLKGRVQSLRGYL